MHSPSSAEDSGSKTMRSKFESSRACCRPRAGNSALPFRSLLARAFAVLFIGGDKLQTTAGRQSAFAGIPVV